TDEPRLQLRHNRAQGWARRRQRQCDLRPILARVLLDLGNRREVDLAGFGVQPSLVERPPGGVWDLIAERQHGSTRSGGFELDADLDRAASARTQQRLFLLLGGELAIDRTLRELGLPDSPQRIGRAGGDGSPGLLPAFRIE